MLSCSSVIENKVSSQADSRSGVSRSVASGRIKSCLRSIFSYFKRTEPRELTGENIVDLERATELQPERKPFTYGEGDYLELRADVKKMKKLPEYNEFLENSVEVIYTPIEPYGHIRLRVGKELYSFETLQTTLNGKAFSPRIQNSKSDKLSDSHGMAFYVGKEKIEEMKEKLREFYKNSAENNFPPFDAYGSKLELLDNGVERSFKSPSPAYGNNNKANGIVIKEGENYFLESPGGYRYQIEKDGPRYYAQSYSCSSSATHVLQKFFDIKATGGSSAALLIDRLISGRSVHKPDVIIKYHTR